MNCPVCGGETTVIDSRANEDSVRRRRVCMECEYRFTTTEIDKDMYDRMIAKIGGNGNGKRS